MKPTKAADKDTFVSGREGRVVTRPYHGLSRNVLCVSLSNGQLFQLLSQQQISSNS